jgi:jumonji domain-containing protein 7
MRLHLLVLVLGVYCCCAWDDLSEAQDQNVVGAHPALLPALLNIFAASNTDFEATSGSSFVRLADERVLNCLPPKRFSKVSVFNASASTLAEVVDFVNRELQLERTTEEYGMWLKEISENVYETESPKCEKIDRSLSFEELVPYMLRSQPLVFKSRERKFPPGVSLEDLKAMCGEEKVWVKVSPNGQFEGVESASRWGSGGLPGEKIKDSVVDALGDTFDLVCVRAYNWNTNFSEFIERLKAETTVNRLNQSASFYLEYFPNSFVNVSDLSEGQLIQASNNIWLGDGKTVGKLHFDEFDNLMSVESGKKTFRIAHPFRNENLYERHIREARLGFDLQTGEFHRSELPESTCMVMSPVGDPTRVDLKRFPKFKPVNFFDCEVNAGETLFLPSFWHHEVTSAPNDRGFNLATNIWYTPLREKLFPCESCRPYLNEAKYSKLFKSLYETQQRKAALLKEEL